MPENMFPDFKPKIETLREEIAALRGMEENLQKEIVELVTQQAELNRQMVENPPPRLRL